MFDILFFWFTSSIQLQRFASKIFQNMLLFSSLQRLWSSSKRAVPRDRDYNIECKNCLKRFYSKSCYEWHMKAVCRLYYKCDQCFRIYYTYVPRICGEFFCRTCYVYHEPDKGCYISPVEDFKTDSQIIMVFDFEVHAFL